MAMESPAPPSNVVIAFDATRDYSQDELNLVIEGVKLVGGILRGGDTLLMLGVLHKVLHPLGYQLRACPESLTGTSIRAMEEEVSKQYLINILLFSTSKEDAKALVSIEVQITAGFPIKQVIVQEVATCKASWVILERHLRRDLRFYLKQISCKIASIQDSFSVDVLRPHSTSDTDDIEHKLENSDQSVISCRSYNPLPHSYQESSIMFKSNLMGSSSYRSQEHKFSQDFPPSYKQKESGMHTHGENRYTSASQIVQKQHKHVFQQGYLEAPILCAACGTRTDLYLKDSMRFNFSQIQLATNDFSKENLLGEGGYGRVYKGKLKDGQLVAAKVRKEESQQGFAEFHSEVYVLNFARHKNIVTLLGYCCKENQIILVYEYICNMSLDWHSFDKQASVLEWHQRFAIAIGIAKGLRFLHEECRGGPIIHRDLRPSNILLTHEFVPMLADFGLAKWKTSDDPVYTRILGTLGYLAPEYAEDGIVSVRTDVYSFGIVLLQLISGRKAFNVDKEEQQQPLRQWAEPLIQRLALHELIDSRLEESYDTYELYIMAKTAFLCVQRSAEMRPSMGEVVRLLDVGNDHFQQLREQFVPQYTK
ncbi:probable serine/threonine-protein kinase PBL8 [Corylus avellana]|uniref:probable serine/threonine-protein kinase PBL8 n=1 Tax=Corylus avellana TaxID=13451 RepID=UPI00286CF4D5|nr:probable serine/threonine-protein kinase PBL8 [Corylus avellana]